MQLPYDPADGAKFWEEVSRLPGYPAADAPMPIHPMLFESGAVFKTSQVLQGCGAQKDAPLLLVMDPVPMRRENQPLKETLAALLSADGWQVQTVLLEPDASGQVHTDMPHIESVRARLSPGCAVLALGSGVVCDIAKHACFLFQQAGGPKLPFVVFQTANSVSAFTSNMAPVFVDGVKRTLPSRYPDALICDLETLRDAPTEMSVGGVGDLLAAFVSLPDWYLANRLGLDPSYSEMAERLVGPLDEIFLEQAAGIRAGSLESTSVLAKAIALGGLAMSLSHATTPMSGYEHVISHVLDMPGEISGEPLVIHGIQVGLASVLGALAYRHFLDEFDPDELNIEACYPSAEEMKARIEASFARIDPSGKAAAECWSDYAQKLSAWQAHRPDFEAALRDWSAVRARLERGVRPAEKLVEILRAVGSPLRFEDLTPPLQAEDVKFAFLNASLMRKRLTIGDLLIFTHWDRESLWQQIWQRMHALAEG